MFTSLHLLLTNGFIFPVCRSGRIICGRSVARRRLFMRKHKIFCLLLIVCIGGLTFAQKKPREQERKAPGQVKASAELNKAVAEGKGWKSAAPDLVMTADQISVNGDTVTVSWSARGTHTGQGHGLKPTGKRINMRGRSTFRVVDGKIVEAWNEEYRDELFRQLGVPKTAASMIDTSEKLWATVRQLFPDPLYASLQ